LFSDDEMTLYVCANAYSGLRYPGWLRVGNVAMGDVDVHVGSVAISFMEKIGTGPFKILSFHSQAIAFTAVTLCWPVRRSRVNITESVQSSSGVAGLQCFNLCVVSFW
jgi:hypothetical protein